MSHPIPESSRDPQPHIMVPTCSYRMGVPQTGYGFITLNLSKKQIIYSVLWNPHRYTILYLYLLIVSFIVFRIGCFLVFKKLRERT